ncbi:hypothetical protein NQZ68_036323 [Dissostichus eleginoides]|nr:hypothetical protein NQZ68_036323 [Dissostichus eleginoides]
MASLTIALQYGQSPFAGVSIAGVQWPSLVLGKYELDGSEAGESCDDKRHCMAVPASELANAAHQPHESLKDR